MSASSPCRSPAPATALSHPQSSCNSTPASAPYPASPPRPKKIPARSQKMSWDIPSSDRSSALPRPASRASARRRDRPRQINASSPAGPDRAAALAPRPRPAAPARSPARNRAENTTAPCCRPAIATRKAERQRIGIVPRHFLRHKIIHARFFVDLRQLPVVAKGIRIPTDAHVRAKFLAEVSFADQQLAHQRFAARHIQIRFHPHPTHQFPAPLLHAVLNLLADRWILLAHPFAVSRGGLRKSVFRIFIHQLQCGRKSIVHDLHRFGPRPQPRRVNMRISRQPNRGLLQVAPNLFQFALRAHERRIESLLLRLL